MGDKIVTVFGTIVVLAIVTTLVLPGRQTVGVFNAAGNTFIGAIRAALGNN